MKITIELTPKEVKGIKNYLKEVCDIENPTRQDIVNNFDFKGFFYSPQESVSDYINRVN